MVSFLSQSITKEKEKEGYFPLYSLATLIIMAKKHLYDPSYFSLHTTNAEKPVRVIPSFYVGSQSVSDAIIPYLARWLSQGLFCPILSMSMQTLEDEVTQTPISIDCEWNVTYNLETDKKIPHWRYTRIKRSKKIRKHA